MANRNLLLTKTAIGCYISFIATMIAVSPNIESLLTRGKSEVEAQSSRDKLAIVVAIAGTISTLMGRYNIGDTYTPRGLPGRDEVKPLQ